MLSLRTFLPLVLSLTPISMKAQSTLLAGDIAIIAFYSGSPSKGFAFVTTVSVASGTIIKFTDNGFDGTSLRNTEGILEWTAPVAGVGPGTVVEFVCGVSNCNTSTAVSHGSISASSGTFNLSTSGDQIIAFQQDVSVNSYIYAVNVSRSTTTWTYSSSSGNETSSIPSGLTDGVSAVDVKTNVDNTTFTGSLSGARAEILARVGNRANWNTGPSADTNYPVIATQTSASAGWRMLSPPASDLTVANLMGMSLVQGIQGEYPNAQTNLFTGYNGNNASTNKGFSKPTSSDNLTQGRGFIWYLFASGGPAASDPDGQSLVSPLPLTLRTSSFGSNANVTTAFGAGERSGATDDGYFLLGNPFARTFDLSGVKLRNVTTNTDITAASLQTTFQIWDGSSYITKTEIVGDSPNSAADDVTRWQGFWARINPVTAGSIFDLGQTVQFTFEVASSNVVGAPVFLYKQEEPYAHLGLHLTGRLTSGASTRDEAAGFFFTDEATAGWDRYDASKLTPLSGAYATVAVWGAGPYNGRPEAKAQESLPLALRERTTYPLRLRTTDAGTFTLSWPVLQNLPERWTLVLTDRTQSSTVDLRRAPAYTFTAPAGTDSTRFTLTLDPGITTAVAPTPAMPDVYVSSVYPNPARNDAQVRLRLGAEGPVTVSVLDVLGREVAVVLKGEASAATHTLAIPTDLLTSGLYTLRIEAGGRIQTRRFAVVR